MVRHATRAFVGLLCVWATTLVAAQSTQQQTQQISLVFRDSKPRLLSAMKPVAVPPDNPPTEEKAALGKRLFFGRAHFWDGRAGTLEAQVVQPISDRNEMDLPLEDAVARLAADRGYTDAFQSVFGQPVSAADLGRALATYLRTIRSTDAPYDRFIAGDAEAMTADQKQGLQTFRTKARCIFCHMEPLFTDEQFQNTGIAWQAETATYLDDGRFTVSNQARDRGNFKTPTLREIARTAPYMHDGSLATLEEVVDFYDKGGRPNQNLFPLLRPLGLTAVEKQQLIKFLEALSGTVSGK